MQPGSYPPGNDPYGQQPPYQDPYAQPAAQGPYGQPQPQPDPYGQQPGYGDPYAGQQYPTSASPYPTTGGPYQDPYQQSAPPAYPQQPSAPPYQQQVPGYGGGYAAPGYAAPAVQNNTPGLLSMIFGIVALPSMVCCGLFGLGFGAAAVVLGIIGLRKASEGAAGNRGQAMAGLICGGVAVAGAVVLMAVGIGMSSWQPS